MLRMLSAREREVMFLVARGLSNKGIARQLRMSEGTVKVHLQSIFRKLAICNRTMLAVMVTNGAKKSWNAREWNVLVHASADSQPSPLCLG